LICVGYPTKAKRDPLLLQKFVTDKKQHIHQGYKLNRNVHKPMALESVNIENTLPNYTDRRRHEKPWNYELSITNKVDRSV
jgi:hypothetical protein